MSDDYDLEAMATDRDVRGLSLDGPMHVIGFTGDAFTTGQTRYQTFSAGRLAEWAQAVADLYGDSERVAVGVTPDAPIIAKLEQDNELGVTLAPRFGPEDGDDE